MRPRGVSAASSGRPSRGKGRLAQPATALSPTSQRRLSPTRRRPLPSLRRDRQAALPHPGPGPVLETRPLQPVAAQVDAGRQAVVVAFVQRRSELSPAPHSRISSAPTSSPARLKGSVCRASRLPPTSTTRPALTRLLLRAARAMPRLATPGSSSPCAARAKGQGDRVDVGEAGEQRDRVDAGIAEQPPADLHQQQDRAQQGGEAQGREQFEGVAQAWLVGRLLAGAAAAQGVEQRAAKVDEGGGGEWQGPVPSARPGGSRRSRRGCAGTSAPRSPAGRTPTGRRACARAGAPGSGSSPWRTPGRRAPRSATGPCASRSGGWPGRRRNRGRRSAPPSTRSGRD